MKLNYDSNTKKVIIMAKISLSKAIQAIRRPRYCQELETPGTIPPSQPFLTRRHTWDKILLNSKNEHINDLCNDVWDCLVCVHAHFKKICTLNMDTIGNWNIELLQLDTFVHLWLYELNEVQIPIDWVYVCELALLRATVLQIMDSVNQIQQYTKINIRCPSAVDSYCGNTHTLIEEYLQAYVDTCTKCTHQSRYISSPVCITLDVAPSLQRALDNKYYA